jgi:hypothetical protein
MDEMDFESLRKLHNESTDKVIKLQFKVIQGMRKQNLSLKYKMKRINELIQQYDNEEIDNEYAIINKIREILNDESEPPNPFEKK